MITSKRDRVKDRSKYVSLSTKVSIETALKAKRVRLATGMLYRRMLSDAIQMWMDGKLDIGSARVVDSDEKSEKFGAHIDIELFRRFSKKVGDEGFVKSIIVERIISTFLDMVEEEHE